MGACKEAGKWILSALCSRLKREQDRRMLQAWRHYTRQRRLKRALFPPTLFSPPARKQTADIQCGTPLNPADNKIGVAWPQMPGSSQTNDSATLKIEGLGTSAGKEAVALEVICTESGLRRWHTQGV